MGNLFNTPMDVFMFICASIAATTVGLGWVGLAFSKLAYTDMRTYDKIEHLMCKLSVGSIMVMLLIGGMSVGYRTLQLYFNV